MFMDFTWLFLTGGNGSRRLNIIGAVATLRLGGTWVRK